jgi:hypothetical protein
MENCQLCGNDKLKICLDERVKSHGEWRHRTYLECGDCGYIFLRPQQRISVDLERQRYSTHNNDPKDERYRSFLMKGFDQLRPFISQGSHGIDYGCGPSQALKTWLETEGFRVDCYDPAFWPNSAVLEGTYDFVTCTEVVEHLHSPMEVFLRLDSMLRPGGWMMWMTDICQDPEKFSEWSYRNDETHVGFYQKKTIEWIAQKMKWRLELLKQRVMIFHKPLANPPSEN